MASNFRDAITFLDKMGIYDVVLPFMLVFTTVFAILEKSRVFGVDIINGQEYTKKNQNSMFAFVTSFLVVASTSLVRTINEFVANVVLLLLLGICFLLLAGVFHTGKEEFKLEGMYKGIFMVIFFVGVVSIFLYALKTKDGTSWLEYGWAFTMTHIGQSDFGALVLSLIVIGLMVWITRSPKEPVKSKEG